jgi:crotonobetainyl-CoA:carnitine CoA-transferase CaiB-like acyl-CoA transferase
MFDFPQVQAQDMIQEFDHPVVGQYRGFTRAITFSRTPGDPAFAAPTLDQHGDALRAEADRMRAKPSGD